MDDKWIRNVRESPAAVTAHELLGVLGGANAPDENVASDLAKVRRQVERIAWLLNNCDPYLVPQTALDLSHQSLTGALQFAVQYSGSQDPVPLASAMANTEAALVHLSAAAIPAESASPAESIANLGRTVSEQIEAAGRQMSRVVGELAAQVAAVDQQRLASEQQTADLTARLEQLRAEVDTLRQSSTSLTSSWQTSFTDEQSTRANQFRELMEEQRVQSATALSELDTRTKATIVESEAVIAEALEAIQHNRQLAEQIVGIISDEALIGEPSKRAAFDKRASFWWSIGSVALGVVAVLIALIAIAKHTTSDDDWVGFGLKVLAVVAVGGVGGYAARQAHEHRRAQRELEHMAVQLAAIKPYLRDMNDSSRDEVLKDVAGKLFGPRAVGPIQDEDVALTPGTLQLVQVLVKALQTK